MSGSQGIGSLLQMALGDWTDEENDLIVADYLAMLTDDLAGRPYSKAEHNRNLQARIGRSRGSIEFITSTSARFSRASERT